MRNIKLFFLRFGAASNSCRPGTKNTEQRHSKIPDNRAGLCVFITRRGEKRINLASCQSPMPVMSKLHERDIQFQAFCQEYSLFRCQVLKVCVSCEVTFE